MTSIRQSLFRYFDTFECGTFVSGWSLFDVMWAETGRKTTPATLLSYLRDWGDISGHSVECIDREKSKYRVTKAGKWGVAGCIGGGRE
mgnify:CR=1 FL=1